MFRWSQESTGLANGLFGKVLSYMHGKEHGRIYGVGFRVQIPKMNPFMLQKHKMHKNTPKING